MSNAHKFIHKAEQLLVGPAAEKLRGFAEPEQIMRLSFRQTPYWQHLQQGRHLGIHRPDDTICNWTARILTKDRLYKQKCVGPALETGHGQISHKLAIARALEWFSSGAVKELACNPRFLGRTREVSICPIGDVYTVGHALRDYCDWTRIARSSGGHYNNLVLINYHLVPRFSTIPLEDFTANNLRDLAVQVLETPPKFGFMETQRPVGIETLTADQLRRRKRTFNSLVSILRMAFQHAWDNGFITSERPCRCLKRVSVNHSPRTVFLDRRECRRLLSYCTPALRDLVLAALYTGCRVGELGKLVVEDVGKQGFGIRVGAFKRSPARFVFVPDEGMAFFLAHCEGKASHEPVLLSDMSKIWRKQHCQLFRRAVAKAGLPRTLVFHGLRHTYASDLIRGGVPLEVVAKQLGHANTVTVSNTYGHLAEQFREEQVREKFSPLDIDQIAERDRRRPQLDALWSTVQNDNWRSYAQLSPGTHHPQKSFARPPKAVLEVFSQVESAIDRLS